MAWLLGVTPLVDDEDYKARDSIRDCRWNPNAVERVCSVDRYPTQGTTALFTFGGSSMLGTPFWQKLTIPHFIRASLDRAFPGQYVVRNLAAACKDSIFVRSCFDRAIEAHPDIVVIYAGHNDFPASRTASRGCSCSSNGTDGGSSRRTRR
jgi:hypothetical protein